MLLLPLLCIAAETVAFRQVAISPDASRVAFVRENAVYVAPAGDYSAAAKVENSQGASNIVWSPNSKSLAWMNQQVYVDGRRVTNAKGYLQNVRWSPDGARLAALFTENAKRAAGPTEAVVPDAGVVGENLDVQRIAVVNAESGELAMVSPAELYVHEFDWSPDGKGFVFTAAPPPGDNNWYDCELFRVDEAGKVTKLYTPEFQIAVPRFSPDGKQVAFIEGIMSDEGSTAGEIYVVDAAGGRPRNLTPERKSSPAWFQWAGSDRILFTEHVGGGSAIGVIDVGSGATERVWQADETLSAGRETMSISVAADGRTVAAVRAGWSMPPEIYVGQPGREWRPFTNANASADAAMGKVVSLTWKSDGFDVQGYLAYPVDFDASRKYPMIVSVHGGPASVTKSNWSGRATGYNRFVKLGYFVFYPNPRGSFGQGERFAKANQRDLGFGDLRDIQRGVDEVLKVAPVDPERIGLGGWSYGGYMAMMAATQTTRFKAIVAGAGISNLQSYAGQNHITKWMFDYFGATVYNDPESHRKSSPMTYIRNAKTPVLILVGERDGECPPPQSYEFWNGLKAMGVKTQLVVYPGEGHGIRNPANVRDMNQRVDEWFRVHLSKN
ncbi:prolyl oligopeptidase [Bryobacterales bacterium F-183]|nr:prolyl oligopeptidase [Bryobacterales bacterium F-183]